MPKVQIVKSTYRISHDYDFCPDISSGAPRNFSQVNADFGVLDFVHFSVFCYVSY